MAADYKMDYLGGLPLDINIRLQADSGNPTVVSAPDSEVAGLYKTVARKVALKGMKSESTEVREIMSSEVICAHPGMTVYDVGANIGYVSLMIAHQVTTSGRVFAYEALPANLERIRRWREICPELVIRSTFIVGFPGETEKDFELLLDWLDEAKLDRVGCFKYEPVKGAPANDIADAVPQEIKEDRWHRFMKRQQAISAKRLKRKVGTRQQVIIDEVGPTAAKGRTI